MSKGTLGIFLLVIAMLQQMANADEFEQMWQQPLQITLPDPTRSILLAALVEPVEWLNSSHIVDAQIFPQGQQTLVQFAMDDDTWSQRQPALCDQSGVMACDSGACQAIQFRAEASNANNGEAIKARIVRNPPAVPHPPSADDEGSMCTTPMALPLESADSAFARNLNLDLDLRRASESQTSAPAAIQQTPTTSNAARSAADFKLDLLSNFSGGATLAADHLPADTSGYTLLVGEGCNAVQVPLDSVAPAHMPNIVVALVNTSAATVASKYGLTLINETKLSSSGESMAVFVSSTPVLQILPLMLLDPDILAAQREFIYTTTAGQTPTYSDPFATFNYGPRHTGALALHPTSSGKDQIIAIIDTGVALEHPDLVGRVESHDFTGKGWSADAHGTAVAGIIAAAADNALGSYGVAPKANILALKACHPTTQGSLSARCLTSTLVLALDAAILADAQIINMSLAGPPDPMLARYVALAVKQNRLVIAGAGNGGPLARPAFPAALPGVLAVTAIDNRNRAYKDANRGGYIDLAAPGVDIVTAGADGSFPSSSGTSWAAAHVSGVAALLRPLMPLSKSTEMAFLLQSHSTDLGEPGKDEQFGYGVINVCAAAAAATADAVTCQHQESPRAMR